MLSFLFHTLFFVFCIYLCTWVAIQRINHEDSLHFGPFPSLRCFLRGSERNLPSGKTIIGLPALATQHTLLSPPLYIDHCWQIRTFKNKKLWQSFKEHSLFLKLEEENADKRQSNIDKIIINTFYIFIV